MLINILIFRKQNEQLRKREEEKRIKQQKELKKKQDLERAKLEEEIKKVCIFILLLLNYNKE